MDDGLIMLVLIFIIAFLYSSVGHGGASGYIAVMAIFGLAPQEIRVNALLLNILVASISCVLFLRMEKLDKRMISTLILSSIPMAYLGGSIRLEDKTYMYLLALILIFPVMRFSGIWQLKEEKVTHPPTTSLLIAGGIIGFLSGVLGIGGGILLTPLLLWFGWSSAKQAALTSAIFIVLNSLAGYLGLGRESLPLTDDFFNLLLAATGGGLIGAYFGAIKFEPKILKKMMAFVLCIAIYKLVTY